MTDQRSPDTELAEAEPRRLVAATPSGRRPLIEAALLVPTADNDVADTAELSVQLDRAERRITVRGEFDLAGVPALADVMALQIALDPGDTTIDLSGVSFIDAAGMGCLVGFANQLAEYGSKVSLMGASARLRRVFDIVQLGGLLQAPGPRSAGRSRPSKS